MKSLIYSTFREGYGPDQVRRTMTVGELIAFLEDYDEDTPVYLSFDNGYCFRSHTPPSQVTAPRPAKKFAPSTECGCSRRWAAPG